jgi:hypothetical protein
VRVFAAAFVPPPPRTPEEQQGWEDLRSFAEQSGGFAAALNLEEPRFQKPDQAEQAITPAANLILALATNFYEVSLEREPSGKLEKLSLKTTDNKTLLNYPRFVPPCSYP